MDAHKIGSNSYLQICYFGSVSQESVNLYLSSFLQGLFDALTQAIKCYAQPSLIPFNGEAAFIWALWSDFSKILSPSCLNNPSDTILHSLVFFHVKFDLNVFINSPDNGIYIHERYPGCQEPLSLTLLADLVQLVVPDLPVYVPLGQVQLTSKELLLNQGLSLILHILLFLLICVFKNSSASFLSCFTLCSCAFCSCCVHCFWI